MPVILTAAGLGSAVLVAVAMGALFRRRSLSYFLVTVAIGTFTLRTFLAIVTFTGLISEHTHHLVEHVFDVVVIGLLFAAVYATRRTDPRSRSNVRYEGYNE